MGGAGGVSVVRVSGGVDGVEVFVYEMGVESKADFMVKWQERGEALWLEVSKKQKLEKLEGLVGSLSEVERRDLLELLKSAKS